VRREFVQRRRDTFSTSSLSLLPPTSSAGCRTGPSRYERDRRRKLVWLCGVVVRALDLRLEVAGSITAAVLSSATLDKLSGASEVTTLWRYMNQCKLKNLLSVADEVGQLSGQLSGAL